MPFFRKDRVSTLNGIFFVALFAIASIYISRIPWIQALDISPLIISIALGMLYGNTLRHKLPTQWVSGIHFTSKYILRLAIILYGFRITFQDVYHVGLAGLFLDLFSLITVFFLSLWLGRKLFRLDRDTSILIGSGFGICGAAAVLATEGVLKCETYKAATALATVVLFGTIALFLYPALQTYVLGFTDVQFGAYVGSTVHEVAQVIAIGNAISPVAEATALIVKMTRVMLLAPFLALLGLFVGKKGINRQGGVIPWFALVFVAVAGINSLEFLSKGVVAFVTQFDTLLLSMAMAAIGIETSFSKIKQAGLKPLYLAGILFLWMVISGHLLMLWLKAKGFI